MNKIKTIFMNMSWLMLSQIITSILAFIWTILIARYLGVTDYGIFGYVVSLSGMFAILCDLGMSTHIVRSVAVNYENAKSYLGNAIPLKLFLSALYFSIVFILLLIWHSSTIVIYLTFLFVLESIIKNFCSLFYGVFQAHEKGKYQAIANIILAILSFALILFAIYIDSGLSGVSWAYVLANVITLIYTCNILLKIVVPKIEFDFKFWKQLIIWGMPFALTSIFYTIYYSIDIVMLTQMVGDYATGIYNATYKLINVLTLFNGIYIAVIFPVMSKLYKSKNTLMIAGFEKSTKYLAMVSIPICMAILFYSNDIIHFVYGNQYNQAEHVLQILIWSVCFLFINGAANQVLNASHKEVAVTRIFLIAAIFNVCLNLFLIPNYSFIGASIATVSSEIIIFILFMYSLNKINIRYSKHLIIDFFKIIFCSIVLGIILHLLKLNMWIAIPVGIIIYLLLLYLTKSFDNGDKYVIKQILGK